MINESRQIANILFPPEEANPRREHLVDILRATRVLVRLPLSGYQLNDLKSWMEKNVCELINCQNIEWYSGKGPIFSHLVRLLAAVNILSCFQVDIIASESIFRQLFSQIDFHPVLRFLMSNFQDSNGI